MVRAWDDVRRAIVDQADRVAYAARVDRMLYASSVVPNDGSFEARMKPLRQEFVRRCLIKRCASRGEVASFVDIQRFDANATRAMRDGLRPAGSTSSSKSQHSLQFSSKCFYRSILVLQGRSAWLDHWKMDLACGSPVVFMADQSTPSLDGFAFASSAYSFYSRLLQPGEHYIHVEADHLKPDAPVSVRVGPRTELTAPASRIALQPPREA